MTNVEWVKSKIPETMENVRKVAAAAVNDASFGIWSRSSVEVEVMNAVGAGFASFARIGVSAEVVHSTSKVVVAVAFAFRGTDPLEVQVERIEVLFA